MLQAGDFFPQYWAGDGYSASPTAHLRRRAGYSTANSSTYWPANPAAVRLAALGQWNGYRGANTPARDQTPSCTSSLVNMTLQLAHPTSCRRGRIRSFWQVPNRRTAPIATAAAARWLPTSRRAGRQSRVAESASSAGDRPAPRRRRANSLDRPVAQPRAG